MMMTKISTSLRNVIRNPHYLPAIIDALRRMQERGCSNSVRIVWMNTMPYPNCHDDVACLGALHFKTTPAIQALETYMTQLNISQFQQWT